MFGADGGLPEPQQALDSMSLCCSSEPHTGRSRQWSMVVIRESGGVDGNPDGKDGVLSVFPPSNHENLRVPSGPCDEQRSPSPILTSSSDSLSSPSQFFTSSSSSSSSSSCSSSLSSSDVDEELQEELQPSDSAAQVREPGQPAGLLGLAFRLLGSKAFGAVSSFFGRSSARRGLFWLSFASTAVVLWWVYRRFHLLRLRHRESVDGLMRMVKERDEKIAHLLHQIAQMNEVLLSRHKALTSKLPG